MDENKCNIPEIVAETDIESRSYDGILLVATPNHSLKVPTKLTNIINDGKKYDLAFDSEVTILPISETPAKSLIYAGTGPVDVDYDDVRILKETAIKGVKRALKAGLKDILVVLEEFPQFENSQLITLLGVLEALYTPIHLRERNPLKAKKLNHLGVYTTNINKTKEIIRTAKILENGLYVARDIGGADPERMAPPRAQKYVEEIFSKSSIKLTIIDDINILTKEYPLFEAVNRAASGIERHRGRIMYLEYNPPSEVKETLFLVGKGVTYDTGGADVKVGGAMVGMSRDKCGAAAVAGFMKVVDEMKPKHTKIVSALALIRNSIGSNSYVVDEILLSKSKQAIRIGNTDAEGRLAMADILYKFKEMALDAVNPHLFTIATLSGHAVISAGLGYSIVVDNGPARKIGFGVKLQENGSLISDPLEVSYIRREDIAYHRGKTEGEDLLQSGNRPSTQTPRGHQSPAGFLALVSEIHNCGSGSQKPLKYSHIDIAPSAGDYPHIATGAPILALARTFLL